jgi:hypothetical protein
MSTRAQMTKPPIQQRSVATLNRAVSLSGPQKGINRCFIERGQPVMMLLEPMSKDDDKM